MKHTSKAIENAEEKRNCKWIAGRLEIEKSVFYYWVKLFEKGSRYGIEDDGKIIKMTVKENGRVIINYDRGWDIEPETEAGYRVYAILVSEYN